jgi:hypothetical protein
MRTPTTLATKVSDPAFGSLGLGHFLHRMCSMYFIVEEEGFVEVVEEVKERHSSE